MVLTHLWVAIIAGGKGTRLFPISHPGRPKQFCKVDKRNTFIQAVVENFVNFGVKPTNIVVITTDDGQTKLAREQVLPRKVLSQNIYQIDPHHGYAGAMIKAAKFIHELDSEAVIINTPADQYLVADEDFKKTLHDAINDANNGYATIVGVKVNDIVTAMGCGHVIYKEDGRACPSMICFIEKPDYDTADRIMRQGNSACNTGINVWRAKNILQAFKGRSIKGLATDAMMKKLGVIKVAVGNFEWHDCGTLKSFYEISSKNPDRENANLGGGLFELTDCRRSLFYAEAGMELRVSGARDDAVVFTVIDGKPVIVVAKMEDSQVIKFLADDYLSHQTILTDDFSMGARNNIVLRSNVSDELIVGFVGVGNYAVYVHRDSLDGSLMAVVSQQLR